ncbi:MAG: DUF4345 family protein [Myxococcales bacterium]|nr:DUF4345 family protein [Myxococcales bacterium]
MKRWPLGVLWAFAVMYVVVGVGFIVDTPGLWTHVGVPLGTPNALVDVRAIYGGLDLGLGLALVYCARTPGGRTAGLAISALTFAGIALTRSAGLLHDGVEGNLPFGLLTIEASGALIAALAWRAQARFERATR